MIDSVFVCSHSSAQRAHDRLRLPEATEADTTASWRPGKVTKGKILENAGSADINTLFSKALKPQKLKYTITMKNMETGCSMSIFGGFTRRDIW